MKLGVDEAAQLLGVSTKTIYRWVGSGKIPGYRVHKQYRFDRAELQEWAAAQRLPLVQPPPSDEEPPIPTLDKALQAGGVHYRVEGATRDDVLRHAVLALRLVGEGDRSALGDALIAREELAPTAIGDGLALPHLRNPLRLDLLGASVSLCFLDHPVRWGAPDGAPVHTLFVVVGPTVRSVLRLHVETLFALRDPAFREAVARQESREVLFEHARRVASGLSRESAR
ncbi:MAG: helix-turn-helix domain-containing protein [Alphaproteobacteria bacterium]|nr:helix-turn-helix domain-containing protein [Alphaproteobacteria bacterium]MCB9696658.1 helix-turn-helix domain-containing protein [Alphaproteobacteria bacterium]